MVTCALHSEAADLVVMVNGDRFTGKAQKVENGKLFFQSRYSATPLQIAWSEVSCLTTERGSKPKEVEATKASEEGTGWVRQMWDNSSISADVDQTYSGLTKYNQISSNSEIDYMGDRWDGSLVTHYEYYGTTDSRSTYQAYGRFLAQRYIRGDHFFLFPYGFLGRETTEERRGQIRQYGGGAGWTIQRQRDHQFSFYTGVARSISSGFTEGPDGSRIDLRVDEPLAMAAVSWEGKLRRKIVPSIILYYYKPLLTPGHHALATDASIKIPLFGPTYFTIRAYDTPELRQRQLFSTRNLQVSSGIGIEF